MGEQANGLDDFLFLERNYATSPVSEGGPYRGSSRRSVGVPNQAGRNGDARNTAERRAALHAGTGVAGSLRRSDQLQKLLRVVQPLFEFGAERLGSELRRHRNLARGRIGRHKLDFVDADRGILVVAEGLFKLLREVLRLGPAH